MQRRDPRIPTNRPIRIRFEHKQQFETLFLRDISKGGLFVRTPTPRARGEEVTIVLDLPERGEVSLTGRVAHVMSLGPDTAPGSVGMGIALDPLSPAQEAMFARYMNRVVEEYIDAPDHSEDALALPVPPAGPILDLYPDPAPATEAPRPDAAPSPLVPGPPATPAELAALGDALAAIEPRLAVPPAATSPGPYRVLGADPASARATIEESYRREAALIDPVRWAARVPGALAARLLHAGAMLDEAFALIADPASRANLDLALALIPPPPTRTDDERLALVNAANALFARFRDTSPEKVLAARPLVEGARRDLENGRHKFARNALRIAISYSPLDTRIWALMERVT